MKDHKNISEAQGIANAWCFKVKNFQRSHYNCIIIHVKKLIANHKFIWRCPNIWKEPLTKVKSLKINLEHLRKELKRPTEMDKNLQSLRIQIQWGLKRNLLIA
jgi:hypothetical protein